MNILIALLVVGLLLYSAIMLIISVFKPPRRPKLKKSALAFIGSIAASMTMIAMMEIEGTSRKEAVVRTAPITEQHSNNAQPSQQPVGPIPIPLSAQDNYISRLDRELDSMADVDPKSYMSDSTNLAIGLALIQAWVEIYKEGATIDLTDNQERRRQEFKDAIIRKQTQMLPVFRDGYGPIMRRALWEVDGKAKTFGTGFRTVEFVNGIFAANRNIKQAHESTRPMLMMLRFTRAEYKWFQQAREFSYYTLEPPRDDQLVDWNANGSFSLVR